MDARRTTFDNSRTRTKYYQTAMSPIPRQRSRSASPSRKHTTYPEPKLLLRLDDLRHDGTASFLSAVDPIKSLEEAVATVLDLLYRLEPSKQDSSSKDSKQTDAPQDIQTTPHATATSSANAHASKLPEVLPLQDSSTSAPIGSSTTAPKHHDTPIHPPVRSITLLVRHCGGVAYTTGKEIDNEHKEIHFNLDYISQISADKLKHEILGVINHEMVHCWQWNANDTAPGGLIEGIADWVRLNAGLAPPHWKRKAGDNWDAGYEKTGYFLDWLERHKCGHGTVRRLNAWMKNRDYDEEKIWTEICGAKVHNLWKTYQKWVEKHDSTGNEISQVIMAE